jgi:hypothetical protein
LSQAGSRHWNNLQQPSVKVLFSKDHSIGQTNENVGGTLMGKMRNAVQNFSL